MSDALPVRPFLQNLEAYTPGEQRAGEDIVKLNTNESPYPPAQAVIDAVADCARDLRTYPNPNADDLRAELAAYHNLSTDQILVGNGSDEILRLLVHAFVSPGDQIAITDPTYSLYQVLAASFDGASAIYPLDDQLSLSDDFINGGEALAFLPNPNPPLGTLFSSADIVRLCKGRNKGLVVIDEAYVDFAPSDTVGLLAELDNLAIVRTFSKSYSLAGMRVGYLLGQTELIACLMKIKDSYNLSHPAQVAARAAIQHRSVMQENVARIVEGREAARISLEALGYTVPESHGNFLFARHPQAAKHFAQLSARGIMVRYFDVDGLRDGMRITIGLPEEMQKLFAALKDIV